MPPIRSVKKLIAISLLLIMLFNICGYQLVILSMQSSSAKALEKKLDKNDYSENDLVSIKTKLNLPYYQSAETFERVYGSININGKDYEYVKRRVFNDTLELLCLPDKHKTDLNAVKNNWAKSAADHQSSTPGKSSTPVIKISISEYLPLSSVSLSFVTTTIDRAYILEISPSLATGYCTQQERPPQSA